jgi:transposase
LNQLRALFPGQQLHLIVDNSSVHKNGKIRRYLKKHPDVFLYFLPPYSPEYNPVEKIWWWAKPLVYGFSAMKDGIAELHRRIRKLFWHYNEKRIEKKLELDLNTYKNIIKIIAN